MKSNSLTIKKSSKKDKSENAFPIVAIGASAGGLEAITEFLAHLSPNTDMAYIFVQHLSPDHKSILTTLLSKVTQMKVQEIEDMEKMEPNNLYVIPNNKGIEVSDGHIKLIPRPKTSSPITIDILFSSLAETHKDNVVGIVLSGNAHDGTQGLRDIKEAGGITFAQDESAKFESMPKSAIAEGIVDFVLSPKEIALKLTGMSKFPLVKVIEEVIIEEIENNNLDLKAILQLLLKRKNVDFSHYKMNTIKRRILRRMLILKILNLKKYGELLTLKNSEVDLLYQDLLINVTEFFRDTDAFLHLENVELPKLLKSKEPGDTLRIWVTACATGEEVYSIAMILLEIQENIANSISFQIFASDLSEDAISVARIGEYSKQQLKNVSPKRLKQFFTKFNDKYCISKAVRKMCIFAHHNILKDPPFSRMDFISCRNLLIYLDPSAQKKVISTFHYALNEGGYLMLGKSETIGNSTHFNALNKKFKIYSIKKNSGSKKILPPIAEVSLLEKDIPPITIPRKPQSITVSNLGSAFDSILLSQYVPASVIINYDLEILQFRGLTSLYLQQTSGKASFNILKMAHIEIIFELRNAIHNAIKSKQPVIKKGIEMSYDKIKHSTQIVNIEVRPIEVDGEDPLLIVVFTGQEQHEILDNSIKSGKSNSLAKDRRIKKLEEELVAARLDMASITDDQETANEELQSANEEIISSNEELQSLNEELETSKEEIESTNEELTTINQELQTHIQQVEELHNFYEVILDTVYEPVVILDKNIRIKSVNKSFCKFFHVNEEECFGVSLYKLGNNQWNIPQLRELLEDIVPNDISFHDFEVEYTFPVIGHKTMILNAHKIFQQSQNEELIILTITDITEVKKLAIQLQIKEKHELEVQLETEQEALKNIEVSENRYRDLIQSLPVAIYTCDTNGYIQLYNKAAIKAWGREPKKGIDKWTGAWKLFDLEGFPIPLESSPMAITIKEEGVIVCDEIIMERPDGSRSNVLPNPQPVFNDQGKLVGAISTIIDITEIRKSQQALRDSEKRYNMMLMQSPFAFAVLKGEEMIVTLANDSIKEMWGKGNFIEGLPFADVLPELKNQEFSTLLHQVFTTGIPFYGYERLASLHRNGKLENAYFNFVYQPYHEADNTISGVTIIAYEVTSHVIAKNELIEAKRIADQKTQIAEDAVKAKQQFLSNMSHEIRTPMNAIIGFTNVVLKTNLDKIQQEYIHAIKVSGDALIVLINDILDLAKLDSGKMMFVQTVFNLSEFISTMLQLFELKIKEKNLNLIEKYDPNIPQFLVGDPMRLRQIILNLLSNAIKFTNKGTITMNISLLKEDSEKVVLEFTIVDTGIGIPRNRIAHIFNDFEQASRETSSSYGGTGLGLAIVKQLVVLQGGSIIVNSEEGIGSTFGFIMQFEKTNSDTKIVTIETPLEPLILKNIRVLVAEDMALNQMLIKIIIADFGFEIDIAKNGKIAIEKLEANQYDIILMDLQMPEMNGFETTEYIRNKMNSQIPIIALTADVTTVDVEKCKAVGMNDYISKPIDEKLLYSKIVKYLNL